MNPKYRPVALLGMTLVLMAPYLAFVIYHSREFPPNQWPSWFTNVILIWFVANFLVLMLFFRLTNRMFRPMVVDVEKARAVSEKSLRTSTRLVIFWIALLVYGAVKVLQGAIPLQRAMPAGAALLFFIGLFGWSIYRAKRDKKSEPTSLM